MRERILRAMADVFALAGPGDLPADPSVETVAAWDSLHHLELMLAIELEFGIQISTEAMPDLTSLEAIEEHLSEQGVPASA
jgi:acyl carrier protein